MPCPEFSRLPSMQPAMSPTVEQAAATWRVMSSLAAEPFNFEPNGLHPAKAGPTRLSQSLRTAPATQQPRPRHAPYPNRYVNVTGRDRTACAAFPHTAPTLDV